MVPTDLSGQPLSKLPDTKSPEKSDMRRSLRPFGLSDFLGHLTSDLLRSQRFGVCGWRDVNSNVLWSWWFGGGASPGGTHSVSMTASSPMEALSSTSSRRTAHAYVASP
eukprot:2899597-Amphidinium_carterae.1